MSATSEKSLSALLDERRTFPPPDDFRRHANANDPGIYDRAVRDPEAFWAAEAKKLDWSTPWQKVLEWNAPWAKWFVGGKLNVAYNCVDRHAHSARRNKAAIIWEGEPGDSRVLTYGMLRARGEPLRQRASLARRGQGRSRGHLYGHGAGAGHRHACLREDRRAAQHRLRRIFRRGAARTHQRRKSQSGGHLRRRVAPRRRRAAKGQRRRSAARHAHNSRKWWWCAALAMPRKLPCSRAATSGGTTIAEAASDQCAAEPMDAEDMLFVLYTSGTTGKPKGIVHTSGGYLVGVSATHRYVFDIKEEDVYWCTADIGWVTGHSYVVYGPLANGATSLMYEGTPDYPDRDRFWSVDRQVWRQYFLYGADGHSHVHALGHGIAREALAFHSAADRHGRRTHQSRGLDLVSTNISAGGAARSWTPGGRPRPA